MDQVGLEPSHEDEDAAELEESVLEDDAVPPSTATAEAAANVKLSRKRTKTGCLTCRRRRIKCGEERPICNNCIKSKRQCEGYNQRVVFKDPMNGFRPALGLSPAELSTAAFTQASMQRTSQPLQYAGNNGAPFTSQIPLPAIAPRPPQQYAYAAMNGIQAPSGSIAESYNGFEGRTPITPVTPITPQFASDPASFHVSQAYTAYGGAIGATRTPNDDQPGAHAPGGDFEQKAGAGLARNIAHEPLLQHSGTYHNPASFPLSKESEITGAPGNSLGSASRNEHMQNSMPPSGYSIHSSPDSRSTLSVDIPRASWSTSNTNETQSSVSAGGPRSTKDVVDGVGAYVSDRLDGPASERTPVSGHRSDAQWPVASAATQLDDDAYPDDFDMDEQLELDDVREARPSATNISLRDGQELGVIVALQASQDQRAVRSFTTFLDEPNVLASYRPSPTSSPLMDPKAARIFCHFITSTGPSLSMYERRPPNPSVMFTQGPVPRSQQSLWTYTLPTLALSSPPLMHAILALASLHISKLQGGTTVPSLKHYHMALRRVSRYVSTPSKRSEIATLAATLLLGFYEVMANDHVKWNSHLLGARQLMVEVDFAALTQRIRASKARAAHSQQTPSTRDGVISQHPYAGGQMKGAATDGYINNEADDYFVSLLMGEKMRYSEHGRVAVSGQSGNPVDTLPPVTSKDIEDYELLSDLFWWYAKQDMYQSILSGNPLLLSYDRWSHCPPRAPIGRLEAPHGTYDHLVLLIARLGAFTAKDRHRKLKAAEANGGQWRPPSGNDLSPGSASKNQNPSPSRNNAPSSTGPPQAPPGPMMFGMIPPTEPPKISPAFQEGSPRTPPRPVQEEIELEAATVEAEEEWTRIKQAMQLFEESLGPAFQPLSPEYTQPLSTPFGPARYYKTYPIACIWANVHMAYVILHRVHPSMPPAAMMAAGVSARSTSSHATEIGRIAAGIVPSHSGTQINPAVGAALIEISMCLFFAGVQYQDAAQRGWTISKLREIASGSGWESSAAVASGCETSWERAGLLGKGPPYTRTMNPMSSDDRIAGRRPNAMTGPPTDNADRRYITVNPGTRVHWALGILGVEEDLARLELDGRKGGAVPQS
ncbi:MAG: hypothetical protein M1833_004582 [Piccolia ochrophora]|nr:MAG: hypothetical protein M1833_004582 [Piccolia ochrophora]